MPVLSKIDQARCGLGHLFDGVEKTLKAEFNHRKHRGPLVEELPCQS